MIRSNGVLLAGEVGQEMLETVFSTLQKAAGRNVHFYLTSEGGTESEGLAICDMFSAYSGKVSVTVLGAAESMAAVILQAADIRLMSRSSYLMIHQGESMAEGHKKNIRAYLRVSDMQDDLCDDLVLRRIKKKYPKYSWTKFREETNFDLYFSADKAVEWGLADKVVK